MHKDIRLLGVSAIYCIRDLRTTIDSYPSCTNVLAIFNSFSCPGVYNTTEIITSLDFDPHLPGAAHLVTTKS